MLFYIIILQVKLSDREQKDINNELRTPQDLRDCLDDVEIIIGFLSSGGGDANIELRKYVKRALKMEDRFKSKKVSYNLNLCLFICVNCSETVTSNVKFSTVYSFIHLINVFLQM